MTVPTKNFTVVGDTVIDADSPVTAGLMEDLRDNDIHLEEWIGKDYTAAQNHDHNGVNSKTILGAVYKAADETINNNETLQNDDELLFPVLANIKYWFHMVIQIFANGTAADWKHKIVLPSGATGRYAEIFTETVSLAYGDTSALEVPAGNQVCILTGAFKIDSTPGNFQLQWAQNTAIAVDTSVLLSSCINYKVIE